MENKKVFLLEDGTSYILVDSVKIDNTEYVYLSNEINDEDVIFQKLIIEGNEKVLCPIESEKEFNIILQAFSEKYKELEDLLNN